jgi:hypothetical protein
MLQQSEKGNVPIMRIFTVVILATLLVSCSEPRSMIPGGQLSGEVFSTPLTWVDVPETIQVETRPSDPYSINIWGVGIGQHLYIATSDSGTTWSDFINTDSDIRARIGFSLYELSATSITDPVERSRVAAAYVSKYELDKDDNWVDVGLIFRLDRR